MSPGEYAPDVIYALLTMPLRSRWLDIGRVLLLGFYESETKSRSSETLKKKKKEKKKKQGPNKIGQ